MVKVLHLVLLFLSFAPQASFPGLFIRFWEDGMVLPFQFMLPLLNNLNKYIINPLFTDQSALHSFIGCSSVSTAG